jgi:hypothetical protein
MANIHFLRKLAADELMDTLFFATGVQPTKIKSTTNWTLNGGPFKVVIVNNRNISVNGDKCKSVPEAKYVIQDLLYA